MKTTTFTFTAETEFALTSCERTRIMKRVSRLLVQQDKILNVFDRKATRMIKDTNFDEVFEEVLHRYPATLYMYKIIAANKENIRLRYLSIVGRTALAPGMENYREGKTSTIDILASVQEAITDFCVEYTSSKLA